MEYALTDAITRVCPAGHVVNMSLGGGYSQTTNDAADALVRAGLFVAAAAGNENQDASKISPASAPLVCTVGATDGKDARASFSNYGEGIDVWAPGVDLISTSYKGGTVSLMRQATNYKVSPLIRATIDYRLGNLGLQPSCCRSWCLPHGSGAHPWRRAGVQPYQGSFGKGHYFKPPRGNQEPTGLQWRPGVRMGSRTSAWSRNMGIT